MSTFDDINRQAAEIVDKVKSGVGGLVDDPADKVADLVDKVTDVVDDSTGGGASALTAKLDQTLAGAIDAATSTGANVSAKATEAANALKDAVNRKSEDN